MTFKGGPLTDSLRRFVHDAYADQETQLLQRMARRAQEAGIPMIMISPVQARLLRMLVRLLGAKRAIDVGGLFGYSAAALAMEMTADGHVASLELDARHAEVARKNLVAEGLVDKVQIMVAPALDSLKGMRDDASYDIALVDADKGNYENYLEECIRLVRPGGIVGFDNAFAFGQLMNPDVGGEDAPDVEAIRAFHRRFAAEPRILPTTLPVGDGLALAVVR